MNEKEYPIDGAWARCIIIWMTDSNKTALTTTLTIKMIKEWKSRERKGEGDVLTPK